MKTTLLQTKQVADNLKRIGCIELPAILPIIGCDETTQYRNKLEYTFATKKFIGEAEFRQLKASGVDTDAIVMQPVAGYHAKGVLTRSFH